MTYRPYESEEMASGEPSSELASKWIRLVAWIIDASIYFATVFVAAMIGAVVVGVGGGISDLTSPDFEFYRGEIAVAFMVALALLVVFVVQMVLLARRGRTVGKIIMKIRIVDA